MVNTKDKIEKMYRVPCGPMDISADSVCRRTLKDSLDALLDRLTEEVNPNPPKSQVPKEAQVSNDGKSFTLGTKINESFDENLQGNSKMLQDPSGKLSGWREKG